MKERILNDDRIDEWKWKEYDHLQYLQCDQTEK